MTTTTARPSGLHRLGSVWNRSIGEPAYGAYVLLHIGYVALPLLMGIDKFAKVMNPDWPGYLAPWVAHLLPFSAQTAMYLIGVVEIVAGVLVALKPRYAAYVVAAWLAGIVINLLTYSGFYDVALRDFGLLIGALALARLAATYDHAWTGRHPHAGPRPKHH